MKNNSVILSIKDLSVRYADKQVLRGINLDIYSGEIIGYIGPNGAGKSTTIKTLLGMVDSYSGEICIFGDNINIDKKKYKKKIGYLPEVAEVYENLTASEYLTFIGEIYGLTRGVADKKAKELMELFNIKESYYSRMSSFSKGMKQKVLIVASLIHNPDVLFFDEPLSGLDANSVIIFKEILTELASQGKTIFYSSHIMDVVEKISDRIVLLYQGEIIVNSKVEELKDKCKEESLEKIFNQLTGFHEHSKIAKKFVSIIKEA